MPISQKRLLQLFAVPRRVGADRRRASGADPARAPRRIRRQSARGSRSGRSRCSRCAARSSTARGRILAESVAAESIYADPQAIGDRDADARRRWRSVAALQMDARDLDREALTADAGFVWIARQLPLETGAAP